MDSCSCCISRRIHLSLLLLLLLLLLCSTTQVTFLAEGRLISEQPQGAKKEDADEKVMTARALIGSRPPRCDRRCARCGHCEAVQVPAVPRDRVVVGYAAAGRGHRVSAGVNSRFDDSGSNYKPVSWKCKCGDTIVNP